MALKVAIIVVSDTASREPESDKCTHVLRQLFEQESDGRWQVEDTLIVPDDVLTLQRAVLKLTDAANYVNAIVTSGGTGFATKDNTPESIYSLIHKHAPGIVHGMLAASLNVTPFAMMSRPVAGVRNKTLILTLPGSPKGAKENLQSVLKLLHHACIQAAGADSRSLHAGGVERLEKEAGLSSGKHSSEDASSSNAHQNHHHHHHHGHGSHKTPVAHTAHAANPRSNDLDSGPSRRNRSSPYPMLSVAEALSLISTCTSPPQVITAKLKDSLIGHVLASDVEAAEDVPAFRASIVDGYAVKVPQNGTNTKGVYPVAFASHARPSDIPELGDGCVARITTGAPLPPGSNAVVMVEDTSLHSLSEDGQEEDEVSILTDAVRDGENVREIGSDVKAGSTVMRKGEIISTTGAEFGLLASVGTKNLKVFRKPIVGILSTGDEIVVHDTARQLHLGEVRDTNRPTLLAAVNSLGFETLDLGIASDKATDLESTLRSALSRVDVLVTSGGVSMGELDLLKPVIERSLGGTIHFGRVSMKPGKPTTFATVPATNIKDPNTGDRSSSGEANDKVIFSLPGNPASAVVTSMLFVLPALQQMSGQHSVGLPRVTVRLDTTVTCDKVREEYHRAAVYFKPGTGENKAEEGLWASSTGGQRSSRIGSFKAANALLKLPAGGGNITQGSRVEALLMGSILGFQS